MVYAYKRVIMYFVKSKDSDEKCRRNIGVMFAAIEKSPGKKHYGVFVFVNRKLVTHRLVDEKLDRTVCVLNEYVQGR